VTPGDLWSDGVAAACVRCRGGFAVPFTAEAAARAVRVNRTCEPNPKLQPQYEAKAALFAAVYPTLAGLNHKLWLGRNGASYKTP
jgi:hypothetical protein